MINKTLVIKEKVVFNHEIQIKFDGTEDELDKILGVIENNMSGGSGIYDVSLMLSNHNVICKVIEDGDGKTDEMEIEDIYG